MLIASFCLVATLSAARASSPADAREVARLNNCPPKKIEVFSQALGVTGKIIYRVSCNMPKSVGQEKLPEGTKIPDAVLIECTANMCDYMRPTIIPK